ncbi:hypothetical protein PR048_031597 [Dryococelus australis]|uniref:Uncharacterized protein n=1 Tax=Dryococelus australis TaxID=614101 RepID=A0ABQ9G8I6_9NEOP|nr:hypothetical protein PR048_031597 [Dryococelus australis]
MKRRGKREIPEKTRRPTVSSGAIPTCENPVSRPEIEPGSPWWEASGLAAQPPWPLAIMKQKNIHISPKYLFSVGTTTSRNKLLACNWVIRYGSCSQMRGEGIAYDLYQETMKKSRWPYRGLNPCLTLPLIEGFSRESPVSSVLAFRHCSILTSFHPHWLSIPQFRLLHKHTRFSVIRYLAIVHETLSTLLHSTQHPCNTLQPTTLVIASRTPQCQHRTELPTKGKERKNRVCEHHGYVKVLHQSQLSLLSMVSTRPSIPSSSQCFLTADVNSWLLKLFAVEVPCYELDYDRTRDVRVTIRASSEGGNIIRQKLKLAKVLTDGWIESMATPWLAVCHVIYGRMTDGRDGSFIPSTREEKHERGELRDIPMKTIVNSILWSTRGRNRNRTAGITHTIAQECPQEPVTTEQNAFRPLASERQGKGVIRPSPQQLVRSRMVRGQSLHVRIVSHLIGKLWFVVVSWLGRERLESESAWLRADLLLSCMNRLLISHAKFYKYSQQTDERMRYERETVGQCGVHAQKTNKRSTSYSVLVWDGEL